jgi:LacI family transcriptional regulator
MGLSRRVGSKDVARTAGVSIGTVSNVLNRPELVSGPTREVVTSVIESLGYVRLAGARLCGGDHEPGSMHRNLALLASHQVRGVVIAFRADTERAVAACAERGMTCVVAGQDLTAVGACSVTVDDHAGGRAAAAHLLAQGHRSVVVVAGPGPMMRRRRRGAMEALQESNDRAVCLGELATEDTSLGAGRDAGQRLLGVTPRPTAVLCFHDLLALGLMQALHEAGVRVPQDVAVVGYEDLAFAATAVVPLTSVRWPAQPLGMRAGRLLMEHTAQAAHEHVHEVLTPELVVRRSTLDVLV